MTTLDEIVIILEVVCVLVLKGMLKILRSAAYARFKRDYKYMK